MRVNIITQPLFSNYGGILQNYALQEVLRRAGHTPLTINVPVRDIKGGATWKDYVKTIINLVSKTRGNYESPFLNPHVYAIKERELSFPQRNFIKKYISKVDVKIPFTSDLEEKYPADIWIVGSDQVWRPWCSPNIRNYFFDFLHPKTSRMAYAASFGTDKWEISDELTPVVKDLVSRFSSVSVRENSGIGLCKEYLGVDASHVLDPTMLLKAEDYLALTSEKDYPEGKYMATYILDPSKEKKDMVKKEGKCKKLPEVKVGRMRKEGYDTIESWLAAIAHAEYVITDSFHGTVFSLIFHRPVKILKNGLRGNARLESLVKMLDANTSSDGYIYSDENLIRKLDSLSQDSLDYLLGTLK